MLPDSWPCAVFSYHLLYLSLWKLNLCFVFYSQTPPFPSFFLFQSLTFFLLFLFLFPFRSLPSPSFFPISITDFFFFFFLFLFSASLWPQDWFKHHSISSSRLQAPRNWTCCNVFYFQTFPYLRFFIFPISSLTSFSFSLRLYVLHFLAISKSQDSKFPVFLNFSLYLFFFYFFLFILLHFFNCLFASTSYIL